MVNYEEIKKREQEFSKFTPEKVEKYLSSRKVSFKSTDRNHYVIVFETKGKKRVVDYYLNKNYWEIRDSKRRDGNGRTRGHGLSKLFQNYFRMSNKVRKKNVNSNDSRRSVTYQESKLRKQSDN